VRDNFDVTLSTLSTTLITLLTGALLSFIPTVVLERRRERIAMLTRFDTALYAAATEVVAAARWVQHLAEAVADGNTQDDQSRRLDDEHQRLRATVEHIRFIGDAAVQFASREVLRQSYAMLMEAQAGIDPCAN
jgi:hypothetical protein